MALYKSILSSIHNHKVAKGIGGSCGWDSIQERTSVCMQLGNSKYKHVDMIYEYEER